VFMAKRDEILEIEELERNYNINQYTIRYDSKTKRFFKGFGAKVAGGGIISTSIFATLGVATLATGGFLGLTVAGMAGIAVGAGTLAQTVYSGVVYGKNMARSRFKHLGIGGIEDEAGTIEVIRANEAEAYELTQMLENNPRSKAFKLEDGTYPRRVIKHIAKEKEDIAYHGLKYILDQALTVSDKINALKKKKTLTANEGAALSKYWGILDRIAECVKDMAINRDNFNPYKNLIVSYMKKGCLLGFNDEQNNQIRALPKLKDDDLAFKLYSNMYEMPLRKQLVKDRQATIAAEQAINDNYKDNIEVVEQLIVHDGDITKLATEKHELAKKLKENNSYYVLINLATQLANAMPDELETDKVLLLNTSIALQTAVKNKDKKQIVAQKTALDRLVNEAQGKINMAYFDKGDKARKASFDRLFKSYEQQSENLAVTEQALKVARKANAENKAKLATANKQLEEERADRADDLLDLYDAEQQLSKTQQQLAKRTKGYERAVKMAGQKRAQVKQANAQIENLQAQIAETDEKLRQEIEKATTGKRKSKKAGRIIAKMIEEKKHLQDELHQAESDRDEASRYAMNATSDYVEQTYINRGLTEQLDRSQRDLERALSELFETEQEAEASYTGARQLANHLTSSNARNAELSRANAALQQENDDLIAGQSANIATIMELEATNQVLAEDNANLSNQNAEFAKAGADVAYDLRQAKSQLARVRTERDAYRRGVADLMDKNAELTRQRDEAELRAGDLQGKEDFKRHNFMRASALRRLTNLVNKVDAHIAYTLDQQGDNHNAEAVGELQYYVSNIRAKNPNNMTMDDITETTTLLKTIYGVHSKKLAKVGSKTLKEMATDSQALINK